MEDNYKKGKGTLGDQRIVKYALVALALVVLAVAFSAIANTFSSGTCKGILLGPSKDTCLFTLALSTNNYSMCKSLLGSEPAQCYLQISQSTGNSSLCSSASKYGGVWGNQCYLYFENKTGSASYCSSIVGEIKDQCLANSAIQNYNVSYCTLIPNLTQGASCEQAVLMNSALRANNASYCAALSGTYDSNQTQYLLGALIGNARANASELYSQSAYFSYMQGNTYLKSDICYLFFSALEHGANYCPRIVNPDVGSVCNTASQGQYTTQVASNSTNANSTNSPAYYKNMIDSCSNQNASIYSLCSNAILLLEAIQTKNVTICSSFQGNLNAQCFEGLAKAYNNATYCSYISNGTYDYSCAIAAGGTNYTSG